MRTSRSLPRPSPKTSSTTPVCSNRAATSLGTLWNTPWNPTGLRKKANHQRRMTRALNRKRWESYLISRIQLFFHLNQSNSSIESSCDNKFSRIFSTRSFVSLIDRHLIRLIRCRFSCTQWAISTVHKWSKIKFSPISLRPFEKCVAVLGEHLFPVVSLFRSID